MASSKGQEKGRGHSPSGNFGHGGHHRKDFSPAAMNKNDPHANQDSPEGSGVEQ